MPFFNPEEDEDMDIESKFNIVIKSDQWNNMKDINDPTDNKSSSSSK
jgi:hypothetical protein